MNEQQTPKTFINISERYGSDVEVILSDYFELNPTGDFVQTDDEIIEYNEDGERIEVVAEVQ